MQCSLVPILDGNHGMMYSHSGWGGYIGADLHSFQNGNKVLLEIVSFSDLRYSLHVW